MRIGQLADQLGLNPKTIRFYEAGGLLPEPDRTASGYRSYTATDAERVTFIKTAQRLGMSLDEIREVLAFRDRGEPPCAYVRRTLRAQVAGIDQRITELVQLRDQLVALDAQTEDLTEDEGCYCGIIEHADAVHSHLRD
ncbi:MAG: heavy metal-responsive transcriptional regulator [Catenulispora sp.]|nr:heavy metal-responsive transcriptional regulator [Catenulispora sp.]